MTPIPVSDIHRGVLRAYETLLGTVNRNVNLISRSERDHLWEHHILHCLVIAIRRIPSGVVVADWGTGGGLPAIPLSILWPEVRFLAVDSNAKKTRSVAHFCRQLGLENCAAVHVRAEQMPEPIHYSVSRATAPLDVLWGWHSRCVVPISAQALTAENDQEWPPGLICLKGGSLDAEVEALQASHGPLDVERISISEYLPDPYFSGKELIHVRQPHGSTQ